ncbi:MAG: hypothetical protein KF785_15620 [Gemmatimonadales bacterium]|nr:hypothetical protein [Gemmatimonadales bacterium]
MTMRRQWIGLGVVAVITAAVLMVRAVTTEAEPQPATVIDSAVPIEIAVSRFRETIPEPAPVDLDGASSRDALVAGFLDALEQNDIPALNRLLISRAEFAYLYFPSSIYMNRPYQQDPSLVWFMMVNNSERGLRRVLTRDGGRPLGIRGYRCPEEPLIEGENRIWRDCVLLGTRDGAPIERRLFGAIIERNQRAKFLTYTSEY